MNLRREVGLFQAIMLVVGNTIGTGIFTTSGFIIKELKDPGALLLIWILGGLLAFCGALSYAQLGKLFPKAGGEYIFLKESFGGAFGFLAGWISLIVGFSAPIAATAIAFSEYSMELVGVKNFYFFENKILHFSLSNFIGINIIILLSIIHIQRLKIGANFQAGITLFKIIFILILLISGFLWLNSSPNNLQIAEIIPKKESILNWGFPVALVYVMYSYSGWNAAVYIGEEIKKPHRNIPLALIFGTLIIVALYVGLNLLYLHSLSIEEMAGVLEIGAKAADKIFGGTFSSFFVLGITVGLLSVLSAMILAGPRVYYSMARDGVFFRIFSQLDAQRSTPIFSILLQGLIAIVMILTSSFESLLLYIGFTLSLCSSLTVAGLMKIKRKFILSGTIFILANLWMASFLIVTKPITILAGLFTLFIGLTLYYFKFKKGVNYV